jgi:hypothetical protein
MKRCLRHEEQSDVDEIVEIIPAAPGWHFASVSFDGSVFVEPIAGWAQVRSSDKCGCERRYVAPLVVNADYPGALAPCDVDARHGETVILPPGTKPDARATTTGRWNVFAAPGACSFGEIPPPPEERSMKAIEAAE